MQLEALEIISAIEGVGRIAVEQYWALDCAPRPIDIALLAYNIMIEVDGSQHGMGSTAFDKPEGQQFRKDRDFDAAVKAAGRRLVRLHWLDCQHWGKTVKAAIRKVQEHPQCGFLYYSPSYPYSYRV